MLVSHRWALATGYRAECCRLQWYASAVAGRQASRQAALVVLEGRCRSPITHLCGRDSAVLCLPGVLFNHWHTLYYLVLWRCVCVCALAAEPSGLNLCIVLGFVFCVLKYHLCCLRWILHASTSKNAPVCFREISLSATGHVCVSSFIPLLSFLQHQRCEDAAAALLLHSPQMLLWPQWTKQVFS